MCGCWQNTVVASGATLQLNPTATLGTTYVGEQLTLNGTGFGTMPSSNVANTAPANCATCPPASGYALVAASSPDNVPAPPKDLYF